MSLIHKLNNNLRVAHLKYSSEVAYLGVGINVGSSDERPEEYGISHFIEHMLFKGTEKRSNYKVISELESVGGELNAYTTKEDTFIYTAFPKQYIGKAMELLADILFNSTFPEAEMEKEKDVVIDEINSYKDNPAEVIFDEFEEQIFKGHPLGHNILGTEETVKSFTQSMIFDFIKRNYTCDKIVLFSYSDFSDDKILNLAKKYFNQNKLPTSSDATVRQEVKYIPERKQIDENTYQAHSIIGNVAYSLHDKRRLPLYLLCNMLGGPAMNARLNYQLRERNGIGYNIEVHFAPYSNTGIVYIYWGSDENNIKRSNTIIAKELKKMTSERLSEAALNRAKKQYLGQLTIANEQKEGCFLNFGKSIMLYNKYNTIEEVVERVNAVTAEEIQEIAKEIFEPKNMSSLLLV